MLYDPHDLPPQRITPRPPDATVWLGEAVAGAGEVGGGAGAESEGTVSAITELIDMAKDPANTALCWQRAALAAEAELRDLRRATLWLSYNAPGTPVPDWVDAVVNSCVPAPVADAPAAETPAVTKETLCKCGHRFADHDFISPGEGGQCNSCRRGKCQRFDAFLIAACTHDPQEPPAASETQSKNPYPQFGNELRHRCWAEGYTAALADTAKSRDAAPAPARQDGPPEAPNPPQKWAGCGECDSSFVCHNGHAVCIRLPRQDGGAGLAELVAR